MDASPEKTACVVVRARHLDSDDRQEVTLPAVRPVSPGARREELRALMLEVFPDAELRSFDDDVASALSRNHLVVARYVGAAEAKPELIDSAPGHQGELFAA